MEQTENIQTAYCRICGKALAPDEKYSALGTVYCAEHVPAAPPPQAQQPPSPWTAPPTAPPPPMAVPLSGSPSPGSPSPGSPSPGLAFILGLIPGVGAIYNAQYAKGLVHVLIFGLLTSMAGSDSVGDMQPLFGMLASVWIFYMAFEAYHTAKNRLEGRPVEEFSSVIPVRADGPPVGAAVMIGLGVIFLLNNLGLLRFSQIFKFWPVALIVLGVYMLVERTRRTAPEVGRE